MIPTTRFAEIINNVCERVNKTNLDPYLYGQIERALKMHFDGRYSLNVLAGTRDTAIVKYQYVKYYISFNYTTQKYEVEFFKF